jgi:putative copper resistance protein D
VVFVTDFLVLALRALGFLATLQAAGTALFLWVFKTYLQESAEGLRNLTRTAAVIGLLLIVGEYALTPVRMAGSFSAWLDPSLTELLAESNVSTALMVRLVGLALIAISLDIENRLNTGVMAAGAGLALLSFGLMGHTSIHDARWALLPLLLVHLGIAALWFGALIPLYRLADRRGGGAAIARFSAIGKRWVPGIALAGLIIALVFIGRGDGWLTPYGAMVGAKTLIFLLLMGLAGLNAFRFGPRIAVGHPTAVRDFRRTVAAEWVTIALVIAGTAVMTNLYAPEGLHGSFRADHEAPEH